MEQKNDYPESYKPVEMTPPPKRFHGSLSALEMAHAMTPEAALKTLEFMEASGCTARVRQDILDVLILKAGDAKVVETVEKAAAQAREATPSVSTASAVVGSLGPAVLTKPDERGFFADGSDANDQDIPF
jgi:hypothetical protein